MRRVCLIFLFLCSAAYADPWGKDADLAYFSPQKKSVPTQDHSLGVKVCKVLIEFHQNVISQADGPRSNYFPSSSQYTKEAIQKYGFFRGYIMGCDRLMRENDEEWVYPTVPGRYGFMKYDPVP